MEDETRLNDNSNNDNNFNSLEPDVIITDGHILDDKLSDSHENNNKECENFTYCPEISIIPVRRKYSPKIKLRNFLECPDKSFFRQKERSPRGNIRLVSEEEIVKAETGATLTKRKSLPLEKCHICKKFFRRMKTHLLKHEEKDRDPNDPLTCKLCMKGFNTYSNLSIHMRTHNGDKPYICDVCNKSFSQSCNLVNHLRIHSGERPFKCPHCDRAFTQSGNLSNHVRLHMDDKPFRCHFCDRAFTQSGNLNSHIRNNHKYDGSVKITISI